MAEFLISVDPGAANVAWAVFRDRVLVATGREVVSPKHPALRPYEVTEEFLMCVTSVPGLNESTHAENGTRPVLLIEKPQVYTGAGKSKGDPNDLIDVALVVGALLEIGGRLWWTCETVKPFTWKGNLPKKLSLQRLKKALAPEEAVHVHFADHNIVDAACIGMWKLGRYR